jgi:hypothetical protein
MLLASQRIRSAGSVKDLQVTLKIRRSARSVLLNILFRSSSGSFVNFSFEGVSIAYDMTSEGETKATLSERRPSARGLMSSFMLADGEWRIAKCLQECSICCVASRIRIVEQRFECAFKTVMGIRSKKVRRMMRRDIYELPIE